MVAKKRRGTAFVGLLAIALVFWLGLNRVGWGTEIATPANVNGAYNPTIVLNQTGAGGDPPYQWIIGGSESAFYVHDLNGNASPFQIKAGARNASIGVNNNGFVGLGIADPLQHLHVVDGDMPALRLQQDITAGHPAQIWDVASSELGFDIIDVTHYGKIPFTILPNAPTDSLLIGETGHVGLGTSLPQVIGGTSTAGDVRHLNLKSATGTGRAIVQGQAAAESYLVQTGGPANQRILRARVVNGKYFLSAVKDNLTSFNESYAFTINLSNGNVGIKTFSPVHPLQVGDPGDITDGNGARCTTGGVWTNASSRSVKQDIQPLTSEQARETVRRLQPVGYRYKNEPDEQYCGFIAEDVPDLVATNDRKGLAPMDIVAVLTKVVQDEDRWNDQQQQTIDRQQKRIEQQQETLAAQQAALLALTKRLADLEQRSGGTGDSTP